MKTIEIVVSPQGDTNATTRGFAGGSCREASKFMEQALGQRTDEQLTSEFYASQNVTSRRHACRACGPRPFVMEANMTPLDERRS